MNKADYDEGAELPEPLPEAEGRSAGRSWPLSRKSTVTISLVLLGSAFFLYRGCWYSDHDRHRVHMGGHGGMPFFGGGTGFRGGTSAPGVGSSTRGGFGSTGAHAAS